MGLAIVQYCCYVSICEQSTYLIPYYHMSLPLHSLHSDVFIKPLMKFVLSIVHSDFLIYKVGPNVVMDVCQNTLISPLSIYCDVMNDEIG